MIFPSVAGSSSSSRRMMMMISDIETAPSAKICQDVISLKKGVLKIPVVTHIDTYTHTHAHKGP